MYREFEIWARVVSWMYRHNGEDGNKVHDTLIGSLHHRLTFRSVMLDWWLSETDTNIIKKVEIYNPNQFDFSK